MENFVKWLVLNLTGVSEFEVSVERAEGDTVDNIIIKTTSENAGKIIGSKGKVINTLRSLVKIKAVLEKKSIRLNVVTE